MDAAANICCVRPLNYRGYKVSATGFVGFCMLTARVLNSITTIALVYTLCTFSSVYHNDLIIRVLEYKCLKVGVRVGVCVETGVWV